MKFNFERREDNCFATPTTPAPAPYSFLALDNTSAEDDKTFCHKSGVIALTGCCSLGEETVVALKPYKFQLDPSDCHSHDLPCHYPDDYFDEQCLSSGSEPVLKCACNSCNSFIDPCHENCGNCGASVLTSFCDTDPSTLVLNGCCDFFTPNTASPRPCRPVPKPKPCPSVIVPDVPCEDEPVTNGEEDLGSAFVPVVDLPAEILAGGFEGFEGFFGTVDGV